ADHSGGQQHLTRRAYRGGGPHDVVSLDGTPRPAARPVRQLGRRGDRRGALKLSLRGGSHLFFARGPAVAPRRTQRQIQLEKEPRPTARLRLDAQLRTHRLGELAADRQSESRVGEQLAAILLV